ncbi:hypothetical protein AMECASPLE_020807 [Ameca splendens]|uniref:Uncharacterized protein n=1 Tax=Ameca splendens TaxID=208324 RepID=A0ABV0ZQB2_9TELE
MNIYYLQANLSRGQPTGLKLLPSTTWLLNLYITGALTRIKLLFVPGRNKPLNFSLCPEDFLHVRQELAKN